jgi:hypothetical protein
VLGQLLQLACFVSDPLLAFGTATLLGGFDAHQIPPEFLQGVKAVRDIVEVWLPFFRCRRCR